MGNPQKTDTWARLAYLLGERKFSLREAMREMGLSFHRADYYRKQLTKGGILEHLGGGAYDLTDDGLAFLVDARGEEGFTEGGQANLRETPSQTSEGQGLSNLRGSGDRPAYLWAWSGFRFGSPLNRSAPHLENNEPFGRTPRYGTWLTMDGNRLKLQICQPSKAGSEALFSGKLAILPARTKWEVVDQAHALAERAIERAMTELNVSIRKWPSWKPGTKSRRSPIPVPSGEVDFLLPPEQQDYLRRIPGFPRLTSPTSQIDGSGDAFKWETEDLQEAEVMQALQESWETGRTPYMIQKLLEAVRRHEAVLMDQEEAGS